MIAVIADDMTGAAEIAGVCLRYGLGVAFSLEAVTDVDAEVAVIATDTRSMSLKGAVKETRDITSDLKQADIRYIFKKTDSVLRGHVVAEIKAVLEVLGRSKALLVPANPLAGRIISDGKYYIDGVLLSETSFGGDPDFPATSSAVADLPGATAGGLHSGMPGDLQAGITIPDAAVTGDLDRYAGWVGDDILPAGSAAFFEACLGRMGLLPEAGPLPGAGIQALAGKTLVVCGSTHEGSRAFISKAMESPSAFVAEMPRELLKEAPDPVHMLAWENEIAHLLTLHRGITVLAVGQQTVKFEGSARIIRETLARVVKQVFARCIVQNLLVEGGATAFSVIKEMGVQSFTPVCELAKGVVKMKASGPGEFFMTIKPGSYGWPEGLLDLSQKK